MKYSFLFGKSRKTLADDIQAVNHRLLVQGGFVDQLSTGIFSWLPLGIKVLRKVDAIIREEMDKLGGQEVAMPALIQKNSWQKTGRWEGVDVLFKTRSQTEKEYGLGFSHEEVVTPLAGQYIKSYRDLPLYLYQIQTKFRDELRAKSGVLRGREFGMKDLYSFHANEGDLYVFYEEVKKAYLRIFSRCGFDHVKISEASGGTFTQKPSHEFNVLTPAGEVDLLYCENCTFSHNAEITTGKAGSKCTKCGQGQLKTGKAIELGNIFDLGSKFAQDFAVFYTDKDGSQKPVIMGCYGIGNTRMVGAIVELHHDERGIIWPENVAPFRAHLITLTGAESAGRQVYEKLVSGGISVLWDDRDESAGVKFADADLIGIPYRLVVSAKTGNNVEVKRRNEAKIQLSEIEKIAPLIK